MRVRSISSVMGELAIAYTSKAFVDDNPEHTSHTQGNYRQGDWYSLTLISLRTFNKLSFVHIIKSNGRKSKIFGAAVRNK